MPGEMNRRSMWLICYLFLILILFTPAYSDSGTNWKLIRYHDSATNCAFRTAAADPPGFSDIRSFCGDPLGIEFALTPLCSDPTRSSCIGLYLLNSDSNETYEAVDFNIYGNLYSEFDVEIQILNCEPNTVCQKQPIIIFTASKPKKQREPFWVTIDEAVYPCHGSCSLEINSASEKTGSWISVQAESSTGIQTVRRFFFRLKRLGTLPPSFFFEWFEGDRYQTEPYGAEVWGISPTGLEAALIDGSIFDAMVPISAIWSKYQLHGLCAELIYRGRVRAMSCPGFGLANQTAVNDCGLLTCRDAVIHEQNRMNPAIMQAAERFRIPPKILKNLFLAETQFTRHQGQDGEFGLGHLTGLSVDTLLRWSDSAFSTACTTVFPQLPQQCEAGYDGMEDAFRELLKGVIFRETAIDEGITLSARILDACKHQVKWLIQSATDRPLDRIVDYDTLWKLTVATYHAGGECTNQAITRTLRMKNPLDWMHLRAGFTGKCRTGALYVDRVFEPNYKSYDEPE